MCLFKIQTIGGSKTIGGLTKNNMMRKYWAGGDIDMKFSCAGRAQVCTASISIPFFWGKKIADYKKLSEVFFAPKK